MDAAAWSLTPVTPTVDSVPGWVQLNARIARAEQHSWFEKAHPLNSFLQEHDPGRAILLLDAAGVPRAHARVIAHAGRKIVRTEGGVDPGWQRRGIGQALMDWLTRRAASALAAQGGHEGLLRAAALESTTAAAALFARTGMEHMRTFHEMQRSLQGQEDAAALAPGYELLNWSEDRDEAARVLHNTAFAAHWGSHPQQSQAWALRLGDQEVCREYSTLIREKNTGELVAYQLASRDLETDERLGRREGYTELLGVAPGHRGRGLARYLLQEVGSRFRNDGLFTAALDVDTGNSTGALALYESLGYRAIKRTLIWEKPITAVPQLP